jgi:hypothetical protein
MDNVKNKKTMGIRIDKKIFEEIKRRAAKEGRSVSSFMRVLIKEYLSRP